MRDERKTTGVLFRILPAEVETAMQPVFLLFSFCPLDAMRFGIYPLVDTISEEVSAVRTAKVFKNGRSQAIRLPKEFRVESGEVYLKKTPEGFLVVARDPWELFFEGIRELSDDFMAEGRQQPEVQARKWRT